MTPVYFPFSFFTESQLRCWAMCFDQIAMYWHGLGEPCPVVRAAVERGPLVLQSLDTGDEICLEKVFQSYKSWATLHDLKALSSIKMRGTLEADGSEKFSAQIKAEILQRPDMLKRQAASLPPFVVELARARVFLRMADEFDGQSAEVVGSMVSVEGMRRQLFEDLRGEVEDLALQQTAPELAAQTDPGLHMTDDRLQAWAMMVWAATQQRSRELPAFFITDSGAIWKHLLDQFTQTQVVASLSCQNPPDSQLWRGGLLQALEGLLRQPWPPASEKPPFSLGVRSSDQKPALKLAFVVNIPPHLFLRQLITTNFYEQPILPKAPAHQHTLIGYLESCQTEH